MQSNQHAKKIKNDYQNNKNRPLTFVFQVKRDFIVKGKKKASKKWVLGLAATKKSFTQTRSWL